MIYCCTVDHLVDPLYFPLRNALQDSEITDPTQPKCVRKNFGHKDQTVQLYHRTAVVLYKSGTSIHLPPKRLSIGI